MRTVSFKQLPGRKRLIRTEAVQGRDNSAAQRLVARHAPWTLPAFKTRPQYKANTHLACGSALKKIITRRIREEVKPPWGSGGEPGLPDAPAVQQGLCDAGKRAPTETGIGLG